jgi:hypothetical protein
MTTRTVGQISINPRSKKAQRKRKRTVRAKSLAVLIATSAFIAIAPISWNRLPGFGLAAGIPRGGDPTTPNPADPKRKIDPETIPDRGTLITPQGTVPKSSSKNYAYFPGFETAPFISSCKPYRYVIRRKAGPPNGDKLVREALQRISNVTRISFEWGGFTEDIYAFNNPRQYLPFDAPERELWIGWAFDDEVPDLGPISKAEPYAVGVGGPNIVERSDRRREIVGGGVVLRADESSPSKLGPGVTTGNVLIHEILHSLGLAHMDLEGEVMAPGISDKSPDGLGPGDTGGLQSLDVSCPT